MTYGFVSTEEIHWIRQRLLGGELALFLANSEEPYLFPTEDMVDRSPGHFRILEVGTDDGVPYTRHFGMVLDGSLHLADFVEKEERFIRVLLDLCLQSDEGFVAQVSCSVSPTGKRALSRFFTGEEKRRIDALFQEVKNGPSNMIKSADTGLATLLMKLGLREIAMHTFVFPSVSLCWSNHWDLRQLMYAGNEETWWTVTTLASKYGLSLRPVQA